MEQADSHLFGSNQTLPGSGSKVTLPQLSSSFSRLLHLCWPHLLSLPHTHSPSLTAACWCVYCICWEFDYESKYLSCHEFCWTSKKQNKKTPWTTNSIVVSGWCSFCRVFFSSLQLWKKIKCKNFNFSVWKLLSGAQHWGCEGLERCSPLLCDFVGFEAEKLEKLQSSDVTQDFQLDWVWILMGWPSGAVVGTVASLQKGCGFDSQAWELCVWSLQVLCASAGFCPGSKTSVRNPVCVSVCVSPYSDCHDFFVEFLLILCLCVTVSSNAT